MVKSAIVTWFLFTWLIATAMTQNSNNNINPDVTLLSSYFGQLMNETLGVATVQEEVDRLHFTRKPKNGSDFVNKLSRTISKTVMSHVDAVRKLRKTVEDTLSDMTNSRWTPCCQYETSKLLSSDNYKTKVDSNGMCEIIAPTAPANLQPLSNAVLKVMQENRRNVSDIKWQYVASTQGLMLLYPAQEIPNCSFIDPRFRPWFIDTARSHRNNVVLLLDISRSMSDEYNSIPLIDISRDATEIVLKTLTPTDRVGVVAFNNKAYRPPGCFENNLALATESNLNKLNKDFLQDLIPEGESVYKVGFENAFELLRTSMEKLNYSNTDDWEIVLISDGKPKEINRINELYAVIREENLKIGNRAKIFVYSLGRNGNLMILEKIAAQDFGLAKQTEDNGTLQELAKGAAYHIDEPRDLRNRISLLNTNYTSSDVNLIEPTFSVPYVDGGGLGLIFTVGLPVLRPNKELFGVVAIDITLLDIFKNVTFMDNGADTYVFVIEGTGRVITHPLMPQPATHSDPPNFIQIDQLERSVGFGDVMRSMMSGGSGEKTLEKERILPTGDSVRTAKVNATYFWRPINGVNFSVCFVSEANSYDISLLPENSALPGTLPSSSFVYHRLDLYSITKLCRYFYHKSTTSQSLVLFAPRSFISPFRYVPAKETTSSVEMYRKMFNQLLLATSPAEVKTALDAHKLTADLFSDGVISDVIWTSRVNSLWVNNVDDHVAQRFIGTRTGVDRLYPGTVIKGEFDVTKRIWYELAVANPNTCVISPPYRDAGGIGDVVSISRTILAPTSSSQGEASALPTVLGVMGVDFSLEFLKDKVQKLYPSCWNKGAVQEWYCILIDNRGNIILHDEYSGESDLRVKHIASDNKLLELLRNNNFIKQKRCLDLDKKVYKMWYEIEPNAHLNEHKRSYLCDRYFMKPVPHTHTFFVARPQTSFCVDTDCPTDTICSEDGNPASGDYWKCPCTYPLVIDTCTNNIDLDQGVPPCYPERSFSAQNNDCIPANLPLCFNPHCSKAQNASNCTGLVGCTWCDKTSEGDNLQNPLKPYCSLTENCYNGRKEKQLPEYVERGECPLAPATISVRDLILIIVFGCVVFIAVFILCIFCIKRYKRVKRKQSGSDSDEDPVVTLASALGIPSSPTGDRVESPISPHGDSNGSVSPRKQSQAHQVIISVMDSDGAEIIRKPVQLVQGGVTYGAPAPSPYAVDQFGKKRKGANPTTPLRGDSETSPTDASDPISSSNNESGVQSGEEEAGKSFTNNRLFDPSKKFAFSRIHRKRSRSTDIHRVPAEMKKLREQSALKRGHPVSRRPWQSRDTTDQLHPAETGYLPMCAQPSPTWNGSIRKGIRPRGLQMPAATYRRRSADDILQGVSHNEKVPAQLHYAAVSLSYRTEEPPEINFNDPHYLKPGPPTDYITAQTSAIPHKRNTSPVDASKSLRQEMKFQLYL